jgi:hypothetical protein
VAIWKAPSMLPVVAKLQQDPQLPWSLTGVTAPFVRQSCRRSDGVDEEVMEVATFPRLVGARDEVFELLWSEVRELVDPEAVCVLGHSAVMLQDCFHSAFIDVLTVFTFCCGGIRESCFIGSKN